MIHPKIYTTLFRSMALLAVMLGVAGCASTYRTPGAGIHIGDLSKSEEEIAEVIRREPAAKFPVTLAVARLQASGYFSYTSECFGGGRYCVVTNRDIEADKDLERLGRLPMVSDIATMSRILLPTKLDTIKDLRLGAASLKADMLLMYSLDTRFRVETTDIGPLSLISLGFLPNKKAHVTTTASAALFDVRTGFLYGIAEATSSEDQRATVWSSTAAVEKARLKTETDSFQKLLGEFEKLWKEVVEAYAR